MAPLHTHTHTPTLVQYSFDMSNHCTMHFFFTLCHTDSTAALTKQSMIYSSACMCELLNSDLIREWRTGEDSGCRTKDYSNSNNFFILSLRHDQVTIKIYCFDGLV